MVDNLECYRTKLLLKRDSLNNKIPMVYVKYNVPKAIRNLGLDGREKSFTAPARLNRISQISKTLRSAYERKLADRKNQVTVNIESHRLKGLGVGKCYSEYRPPPTAPDIVQRQGFTPSTPSLANSRTSQRTASMNSPNQSAAPSRQSSSTLPSQKSCSQDRTFQKNAQSSAIKQITNIYNSNPKTNSNTKLKEMENKPKIQNQKSIAVHHPTYLHSPMLFSQSHHPGNHEVKGQVHVNGEVQGHMNRGEGQTHEDTDKGYAAYQNVKTDYGSYLNEYNKFYRVRCPTYTEGFTSKSNIFPSEQDYFSTSSSSTPTVPYSTADILYGNEVNGSRGQQNEDVRQNSFGDLEKSRELARSRAKELEQNPNNRRPSSKSGKQRSITIDSVTPFDKDREDPLRSLSSALPPAKPSHHFRPNGIRTNILKPDQLFSNKTNGASSGRDQDDLVAMGTLWSPNNNNPGQPPPVGSASAMSSQQQQSSNRNNGVSNSNTNSFPSKVASSSSSVNHSMSSSNNTLNSQRKYPGNSIRPIQVQNNVSGRKNSNSTKEQEDPKYTDPMIGAPASFQQRLIELGALEGDTVRWERSKRLKKKKADRDS
ncbi:homeobox protein 4-like isoform X2 [Ruditapes philippinarum]|uniref:homeobox protein 4-like isoform X2 n=1 Tax=Ruditapes philippinarum TaxID=129788 RepID=UPI00295A6C65|nr:homeobox protein 4-like isoform X2 [Ruditapes philippinarum]